MSDEGDNTREEVQADPTVVFVSGFKEATVDSLTAQLKGLKLNPVKVDLVGREASSALVKFNNEDDANAAVEALNEKVIDDKKIVARLDRGPTRSRRRAKRADADAEPAEPAEPNFIFVGNLAPGLKSPDLSSFFASYGTVTSSKVLGSWGIVQFSSEDEANASLEANEKDLNGRAIKVEKLRNAPRKRTKKPKAAGAKAEKADKADKPARQTTRRPVLRFKASTTADFKQLKELFAGYGNIQSLEFRKFDTEGEGSVVYETEAEAEAAFKEVNGIDFKGAPLQLTKGGKTSTPRKRVPRRNNNKKAGSNKGNKESKGEGNGEKGKRARRPRKPRGQKRETKEPREPREPREKKAREPREPREPKAKKQPPVRDVTNPECHLFVGNLAYKVDDAALKVLFAAHDVVEAKVAQGRNNRSRGFGSVEVKSKADADDAIAKLNNHQFHERALIVRFDSFVKSA